MTSTALAAPEQEPDVDAEVMAAYAREGYLKPDGLRDKVKIREAMFIVLAESKVLNKRERGEKATTRGAMVARVFPNLPGPDEFDGMENPQLAEAVWKQIDTDLYGMATTDAGSALQRLVGLNMGNGYVLCRTKVGKDRTSALYITDSFECIELDYLLPDTQALERQIRKSVQARELVIYRRPQDARRVQQRFERATRQLTSSASEQLKLAVESATTDNDESADGGDEN